MENPGPSAQDFFLPCTFNYAFNFTEICNCAAILKEAVNLNGAVLQQHGEALALHGGAIPPQQQVIHTPGDEVNRDLLCPQGIQFRTHHQILNMVAW